MRELTDAQNTAQQASSFDANVHVQIGDDEYTQAQIVYCEHIERVFGGTLVVRLNNSDGDLDDSNLKGKEVEVNWGFGGDPGRQEMAHLWVYSTREISVRGKKTIELFCVDNWHKLNFLKLGIGGVMLKGTFYGDLVPGRKLKGSTSDATGIIAEVSPTRTYIFLQSVSGTFVNTENAVDTRDAANYVDITTDATGVTDVGVGNAAGWDKSKDIDEIIGSTGTAGSLLYGTGVTWALDSSDGVVDAYKPRYLLTNILNAPTIRDVIQDLMSMTKCGFRMQANNELHVFDLRTAPDPVDYTYELTGDHTLFENLKDISLMIPNRIVAYCFSQTDDEMTIYSGYGADTDESDAFIVITDLLSCEVDSDEEATALAEAAIHRLKWSKQVGSIKVPMNIGQELFDYITIIDTRMGVTYSGWVGGIIRHWEPGKYEMTVELGQLDSIASINDREGKAYFGPNVLPEGQGRHSRIDFNPMPAIQPFILNLEFSATDNDDIVWNNGTAETDGSVQFANGETQVISHGTLNLAETGKYYLYLIKGNTTLQNTQTFSDTVGADRGIVAIAEKAATATEYASVVSLTGDMFHVGETGVHIAKLSAINADMGLLTAGEIRVGEGTLGSDFTGWRLWIEDNVGRFAGYYEDTMRFYSGTDGRLYCAGGNLTLDEDGIKVYGLSSRLRWYDSDEPPVYRAFIDLTGGNTFEIASREGYDIVIDADDELQLQADDGDIELWASGHNTWPHSTDDDLGTATEYWDDINYTDLIDRTPSPHVIPNALAKIVAMRTHWSVKQRKGDAPRDIETFDRDTFPEEVLVMPTQRDYDKFHKHMEKKLRKGQEYSHPGPQIGTSMNAMQGMMLKAFQEVAIKLDGLESRLAALESR